MRSWAQQLLHQVNLFLCSSTTSSLCQIQPLLLLLPNDLVVIRNQGVDHGRHVRRQEGAGEPRKHSQQGGGPIQFGVQESDFESNSESRFTMPSD
jgi:hypothetical protein